MRKLIEVKWLAQDHIPNKLRSLDSQPAPGLQMLTLQRGLGYTRALLCLWWKSCGPPRTVNKAAEFIFTSTMPTSGSIFLPNPCSLASYPCATRLCFFLFFQVELEPFSQRGDTRFLSCNNKPTGQLAKSSFLLPITKFHWPRTFSGDWVYKPHFL